MCAILYPPKNLVDFLRKNMGICGRQNDAIPGQFSTKYEPWMLRNWPNFSAAPRIWDNFATRRFMLASVITRED
jgi:hypothetical protein